MAVGILTLGLANAWQNGDLRPVAELAERGKAFVECAENRGHDLLVMSEVMLGRDPGQMPDLEAVLTPERNRLALTEERAAAVEAQVAEAQAKVNEMQARLASPRISREQKRVAYSFDFSKCPETQFKMQMSGLEAAQDALKNLPQMTQVDVRTMNLESLKQLQHLEVLRNFRPQVIIRQNDFSNWTPRIERHRHEARTMGDSADPI
jgi:hypothetical protein